MINIDTIEKYAKISYWIIGSLGYLSIMGFIFWLVYFFPFNK